MLAPIRSSSIAPSPEPVLTAIVYCVPLLPETSATLAMLLPLAFAAFCLVQARYREI